MEKNKKYTDLTREEIIELVSKLKSKKKYGIVWDEERVPEKVVVDCQQRLPVLTEVTEKSITTKKMNQHIF